MTSSRRRRKLKELLQIPDNLPCVSHKPQSRSIQSQTRRYQCCWINDNQLWHPPCHLLHNYRECQSPHSSFELDQRDHHKRDTHFSICISATLFNVSHVPTQSLYFNSDRFRSLSFDRAIACVFVKSVAIYCAPVFSVSTTKVSGDNEFCQRGHYLDQFQKYANMRRKRTMV